MRYNKIKLDKYHIIGTPVEIKQLVLLIGTSYILI